MTITQLEYIVAVDREKSFATAAKSCHVTQPTLSMQIKKLENELDVLVFDRSQHPIKTTETGKLLIEQAKKTIREFRRVDELISTERDQLSGTLRLGIIHTLAPYLLPLFVRSFVDKYPDITLQIREMYTSDIVRALRREKLDIGILVSPLQEDGIKEIPVFYEKFLLYIHPDHVLSTRGKLGSEDLRTADMWLLKSGHCFRNQMINICGNRSSERGGNSRIEFESGSLETLKRLVDKYAGYTLLPELMCMDFTEKEYSYVHDFTEDHPVREVSLATRDSFIKNSIIDALEEEIRKGVPGILLKNSRGTVVDW